MSDLYQYNDTQMNLTRVRNGALIFSGVTDDGTLLQLEVQDRKRVEMLDVETKDAWQFVDLIPDADAIQVSETAWRQLK
ncbi:hypothetical protein [Marinobacterium arenosum]|uniref:hypothetical protein n=1 Tax=Marinobacterium arenosum TaxID=2862496 RepID=UPI001C9758A1|nr:hypothetical protein [Marinobacterium arenosum]MBY4676946.1 hypothetical protein [Marinobacterium arenosum]